MTEALSEGDQIQLARAAAWNHRIREECDQANRDLKAVQSADDSSLLEWLFDPACPAARRRNAFFAALSRRVLKEGSLFLRLMDDPDDEVAEMAIRYAPADDPTVAVRLRALLDDPRANRWSLAASSLSRMKDPTIASRLTEWFRNGDESHRNVAWTCLVGGLLAPEKALGLLREAWLAPHSDDDRVMIAIGLLEYDDRIGWSFLVDHARKAESYSACWAAHVIEGQDRRLGLELAKHILDHGATFEVRWGMVEKIAKSAGLGHTWTVDGLAEARFWIEHQLSQLGGSGATPSEGAA
jgi:hypothetical protein